MPQLIHPYENLAGGNWLRGNLHAHTTRSDGRRPVQEVLDDYAAHGYDFLMLSDHDICTTTGDCAAMEAGAMVMIPGNEITANGPHLLHVGAETRIEPVEDRQAVLDAIAASGNGFAIMNHPNWQARFDHCSIDQLKAWTGYLGMEIYNGTIGRLDGSPYATNKWDMLLAAGRRVWGFANDDSHLATGEVGLGWNMAYVRDRSPNGVLQALLQGRFYASTGVTIENIEVHGAHIRIHAPTAHRIVALMQCGKRFATADDQTIEVDVPEHARYVRFECWGDGEQFAWTQPFFTQG